MLKSLGAGLRIAGTQPWIATLLWAWSALLALAAALPAGLWLSRGLSSRPRGDVLLDGFSWDVLKDLVHYDASPVLTMIGWAALGPLLLAALGNAFVSGGLLEALRPAGPSPDPRPRLHRFFRGAGRFFPANLRALAISAVVAGVVLAVALAALSAASVAVEDTQHEVVAWIDLVLPLVVVALVVAAWGAVLDFSRVRLVATDSRGAARALLWGARFVWRHPASTLGLWTTVTVASMGVALAGIALVPYLPTPGWAGIVAIAIAHQALVFVRALLRVTVVAAEVHYAGARGVGRTPVPAATGAQQPALPFLGEGL